MPLDTTAAATSTATPPVAASAPATTTATTSSTPPAAGTTAAAAGATPPATKYEYTEDRSKWLPPDRYNTVARERDRLNAELELERKRIQALTGVTPPDPQAAERGELAKALGEIDPRLGKLLSLDEKKLDALFGFIDHIPSITSTVEKYWSTSLQSTLDAVVSSFGAKGIKISLDDPDDANVVRRSLVGWIEADRTGKRESRFEGNDPKLLDEFVTYFHGRFGAPGQVAASTTTARETEDIRRRLPQTGPKTGVVPTTDATTHSPKPGAGGDRTAVRDLHSRARKAYLDRVGARS